MAARIRIGREPEGEPKGDSALTKWAADHAPTGDADSDEKKKPAPDKGTD
jgi:hypothetical protein